MRDSNAVHSYSRSPQTERNQSSQLPQLLPLRGRIACTQSRQRDDGTPSFPDHCRQILGADPQPQCTASSWEQVPLGEHQPVLASLRLAFRNRYCSNSSAVGFMTTEASRNVIVHDKQRMLRYVFRNPLWSVRFVSLLKASQKGHRAPRISLSGVPGSGAGRMSRCVMHTMLGVQVLIHANGF